MPAQPTADLARFLGHLHPALVHLPIGGVCLLAFLELLACRPRSRQANASANWILAFTVPAILAAATCGWLLGREGGYDARVLGWHRWIGVTAALMCGAAGVSHWLDIRKLYRLLLGATLVLVVGAGHFGGVLTHGQDYLVGAMPEFIRARLLPPSPTPAGAAADGIQPVLDRYCVACHGPKKAKGDLRLDSLAGLEEGGKDGPVMVAGRPDESPLIQRLRLPLAAEDHMPPAGKPQPTPEEIARLERWISSAAAAANPQ